MELNNEQNIKKFEKALTLIIKVTKHCNFSCAYCYDQAQAYSGETFITPLVLENLIQKASISGYEKIDFIWHGGEPLLIKKGFWETVVSLQSQLNTSDIMIRNSIQTNGSLVTKRLARFFKENNFRVSLSLDLPESFHVQNRPIKNTNKGSSFQRTLQGFSLLKEEGINPGVLSVITSKHLALVEAFFDSCLKLGVRSLDILPSYNYQHNTGLSDIYISPSDFGNFLIELFDLWIAHDDPNFEIRYFHNAMLGILGGLPTLCNFMGNCGEFLGISPDGNIYICDSFIGNEDYILGSILTHDLTDVMKSAKHQKIVNAFSNVNAKCKSCKWHNICKSGCPAEFNQDNVYHFCQSRIMLFDHIHGEVYVSI